MAATDTTPVPRRRDWPELIGDWPLLRRLFTDEADVLRVEEYVDGDDAVVRVEAPGLDPDRDVEITISDHTLRLCVERREEARSEEEGRYRSEFRYGRFTRSVVLPPGTTETDITATYTDGILEIRAPVDRHTGDERRVPISRR